MHSYILVIFVGAGRHFELVLEARAAAALDDDAQVLARLHHRLQLLQTQVTHKLTEITSKNACARNG